MRQFAAVGKCIYCGSTAGLSDEHIIPLGLNGDWILPKASCRVCATVTSRFELDVLRGPLLPARLGLGLRSRRPGRRPTHLPLVVRRDGVERVEQVAIGDNVNSVLLPIFDRPGFLGGFPCEEGIAVTGWYHAHYNRMPEEVRIRLQAERIAVEVRYPVLEFARLIAKIGYGYAVGIAGIDAVHSPRPLRAILGQVNDIGCWVGTSNEAAPPPTPDSLHAAMLHRNGDMMAVAVSLFTMQNAPVYLVLLQGGNLYVAA